MGNGGGDVLRRLDVEKFVRAVRVAVRSEDSGNEELRVGISLAEHSHERNRSALSPCHGRLAEECSRRLIDGGRQPIRRLRCFPTARARALLGVEGDSRAVWWIRFQEHLQLSIKIARIERWRQADGQLQRRIRTKNVSALHEIGHPGLTGDRQRRSPGSVEKKLGGILADRLHSGNERKLVVDLLAENSSCLTHF